MFVADLNKKIHYGEIWKFSRKCEIFSCFEDAFQCQSIHQSGENTNCGEKREKLFCENCKLFRTIQVTAQIGQHQRKQQNNIFLLAHWTQSDVQRHNNLNSQYISTNRAFPHTFARPELCLHSRDKPRNNIKVYALNLPKNAALLMGQSGKIKRK